MPTKKSKSVKHSSKLVKHEPNIKAVLSLFILGIAFVVFYMFMQYQETLLSSPMLKFFMILVVVLFALLTYLLFLVNPQKK